MIQLLTLDDAPPVSHRRRAHAIDVHIGKLILARRRKLGISQKVLGDALGLTFQQVQKYERGANRVSAARLYTIAQVLDCSAECFFEGLAQLEGVTAVGPKPSLAVVDDEFARLTSAWAVLPEAVRMVAVELIVTLAASLGRPSAAPRLLARSAPS